MEKKQINCILCGAASFEVHSNYTGYREPQTFEIYSCPQCNTNFSIPRVDASDLYDVIYSQGDKHPGYDRYWGYARDVRTKKNPLSYLANAEPTYFGVSEFLKKNKISKDAKILEIGSGLGYLTYSLRMSGYSANAIELSKVAVEEANRNFGEYYINADLFEYSKNHKLEYDAVISTEVIEHVERPIEFIKAMLELVKPDGYVVLTTPNRSFFPKEMIWESSLPPIHCWWFSEESMKYIAELLGAQVEFVNFKNYFKTNNMSWDVNHCITMAPPLAILNVNNNVIANEAHSTTAEVSKVGIYNLLKSHVRNIPGINSLLRKVIEFRRRRTHIAANERCHYMCAVLKKHKYKDNL